MRLEILVEDASAEAALAELLPGMIPGSVRVTIHHHQGKQDLLKKLPAKLRAYSKWLGQQDCVVVLIDADNQDCRKLKEQLDREAVAAGLRRFGTQGVGLQILNRIAIEELEAWFLGDEEAVQKAFPRVRSFANKKGLREPDRVAGGTWEALHRILRDAGYFREGYPKIETARRIARNMNVSRNRSTSFCQFRDAVQTLVKR